MKAMILAAGRGTRMAPLTDNCPKPLLPVAGKPLIQHHIEKLVAADFTELVINHAYLGHMIEQQLGDGTQFGCQIVYSAEAHALETAGAIVQALPLLRRGDQEAPFLLINGDVWCDWDYAEALVKAREVLQGNADGWLALVDNPQHNPVGDFSLAVDDTVCPEPGDAGLTFAGISVLSTSLFAALQPGVRPLAPILRAAMVNGRLLGERLACDWVDVGTPQRLQQLNEQLLNKKRSEHPLRAGAAQEQA